MGKKILNIPCIGSTDCKLCIHGVESGRQNFDGYWLIVTIFDVIEHILKLGVRSVPSHAWRSWVSWAMPWKWMKKNGRILYYNDRYCGYFPLCSVYLQLFKISLPMHGYIWIRFRDPSLNCSSYWIIRNN